MKRFSFRLQPILELKKRAEDSVKHAIAKNNRIKLQAQQQLRDLGLELDTLYKDESQRRVSRLDAQMLRQGVAYKYKLGADIRATHARIETISADGAKLRTALVAARKETRAIELIREKRLAQWKQDSSREQQQFIDDVSQQSYIRKLHSSADARHAAA